MWARFFVIGDLVIDSDRPEVINRIDFRQMNRVGNEIIAAPSFI